ncbi:T9SS type A sorting domain-containing protein [Gramella jeungdoensis]|uniref:T9SS type A sorting domain-containing protein n=1 Tax=Gramella jeungdoensis TaxID=708091 RepID=A0ABT0YZZ5_9FLAO|nr:LamG-like jellyroll fold domain-containing protein [Gramella jeungdoensis]MCM8569045.1 T9SS type A sorting domain-containing protein [Gramella jeungdoensis]
MGKKLLFLVVYIIFTTTGFNAFKANAQCATGPNTSATASISLQGSSNICSDETISFTSTVDLDGGTSEKYKWQVQVGSGSWTDLPGANSAILNNYSNVQNNSRFRLSIIFCQGGNEEIYYSNTSQTITVNQVVTATASISSNKTEICPNETINFTASLSNQGSNPGYSWTVNGTERGTSSSFSWDQFNDGDSIQLLMTSNKACAIDGDADANNTVESNIINISVKDAIPVQPGAITGPSEICPNTSGSTFSIAPVDRATSYIWTLPSGWTGSSTSTSIDVNTGAVGNNKIIKVRAVNDCGESSDASLSVNVGPGKPTIPSAISDPGLICEGDEITLSVTNDPNVNSYTWTVPSGWTITNGQGSNQITVTAGNYGQNGTVSVYSTNDCLDSDESSTSLSINEPTPGQPASISGDALVCPGVDAVYSIADVQYADSYEWILDGNTADGITGTSFIFNSTTVGDQILEVIAKNECGSSTASSKTISVDNGTPDATAITETNGSANFCPGETGIIFSVPTDTKIDTYSWQVPSGWGITAGSGTNQITVTAGQIGNDGQVQFTGSSNDCGSVTATYDVFVKDPAPITGSETITGETSVCHNATGLIYSIPSIQYATSYTWTVPSGWNIDTGQGSNSITVSAGTTNGNISVYAENDCGQSSTIVLAIESIDDVPPQPGNISSSLWDGTSNTPICPPAEGITFNIDPVTGADTYNWILPTGWEITSGEGTEAITVTVTASADYATNESIYVEAVNICGNSTAQSYDNITLSDYVVTNAGEDKTVCKQISPITISGNVDFNGSKLKIFPSTSGSGTFSSVPNGKVGNFSITYTPSQADINNLSQVVITINTEAPVGACDPGEDEMIINFRPDPTASISATTEVCDGQTAEVTFTATPNTTVTYKIGSGSNQTIQIGDSGSQTITTANLSSDTTYSLVSVQYTAAPNCSKTISGSSTIIVNPVPSVDISYAEQCNSETGPATVTYSNGIGSWETGTFSATGDLGTKISTDGSFIPQNVSPGTYTVTYTITGSGGCSDVPVTTDVTIYEQVNITTQPQAIRVCEGSDAQFEVSATGDGLSYQWYKETASQGNEVAGETNSILNLSGVNTSDAGNYIVVVSGISPCSSVSSTSVALTVDQDIVIDTQPASITLCENGSTSIDVVATVGGSPIDNTYSYQWFKGTTGSGSAISGANSSSLPLNNVTPGDSGDYYVEISGPADYECATTISEAASVVVRETPTVEISGDAQICEGSSAEIYFSNGTANAVVTYILNNNNTNPQTISLDSNGAATLDTGILYATNNSDTDFTYELISVAYPDDPTCSKSFAAPLPSAIITVAANPDVSLSFTDNQTEFCTADNKSYTPQLTGTGVYTGGIFTSNGINIDATTGEFTPRNETAGEYTISYTIPAYGGCEEEVTTLGISIYEEVLITSQPSNLGICSTNDAEFSVSATGDGLTYQWYKDGGPITGATSATLTLPVATSEDAGDYYVMVGGTNACTPTESTQVQSETVTLNVDEDIKIIEPAEDVRVCDNTNASVDFKFVAHAYGDPLTFEWIYADGTPVDPANQSNMQPSLIERDPTSEELANDPGLQGKKVYEGILTINNITSADQASYAVRIDGSANNFTCPEAISNSFNLDVDPLPNAPIVSTPIEYCIGDTAEALTATAEEGAILTWYDSLGNELSETPTPATDVVGSTSYFVTQKDAYCESQQAQIVVTVHDLPVTPPLTSEELNVEYCLGATASALSATASSDHTIVWYDSETSSTPLDSAPTPQTTAAGTINYWVSQTNNITTCESDRVQIIVSINDLPNISITNSGNDTICEGDEITLTASDANDSDSSTTYSWDWTGNTGSALTGPAQNFSPTETTTYTVTATSGKGCVNTEEITINVDPQPIAGTLDGPESVCFSNPTGDLNLTGYSGTITRWEYKPESSTTWTAINEDTPDANHQFSGLTEPTSYRVVVTNGVCDEVFSNEWSINLDPVPVGGELAFDGFGRTVETCSNPGPDYNIPLSLTGQVGEIVGWRYKEGSATDWSTVTAGGSTFTGTTLSPDIIRSLGINQSTIFEVEISSGACTPNAISQSATLGIVSSDIAPNPVTVTPGVVCIGDEVTLSGSTGYGTGEGMEAGAFDYSSITNKGWRIKDKNGVESNFDSSADNGVAAIWLRTNPLPLTTANLNTGSLYTQNWDSSAGDEGNKGFAIVSGPNPSTLETSVFNLFAVDSPVLTFDTAYNLTPGAAIYVEISTDGGETYNEENILFELEATDAQDGSSGNYESFGDGTVSSRPKNKIVLDLTAYESLDNLRIRFRYEGINPGDVWAVDAISLPVEPTNVDLTWTDYTDPENPVVIGTNDTEQWTPTLIGWNDFEIRTRLTFDSTGQQCPVVENWKTISVYAFDSYTTTATAVVGSCGYSEIQLTGTLTGGVQGEITEFPADDSSTLAWAVIESPDGYTFDPSHFSPSINDANVVFDPPVAGDYTLRWEITPDEDNPCTITYEDVSFYSDNCTTLDFDGVDDHVVISDSYSTAQTIEAWVRPESENGPGSGKVATIFSTENYELFLNANYRPVLKYYGKTLTSNKGISPDGRWYHLAVVFNSNGATIYIDGIEITDKTAGTGSATGTGNNFIIGGRYNGDTTEPDNYFSGWIEELRIWDTQLTEDQIRFMMNQHLQNAGNMGVEIPIPVPGGLTYNNLLGYYRLISSQPDPLGAASPITYDPALMPQNGETPDLAINSISGILRNMTTHQKNTAPLPYLSAVDGQWTNVTTWLRPTVWDIPNANGVTGDPIDWNIVRTFHNITSQAKDITVLGLKSETVDKELTIANPAGPQDETNSGQFIRVTHYLLLDGNMDLVGESQLLQDQESILEPASAGWLERDQQGTQSSYNYNYWCSPVSPQGVGGVNEDYTIGGILLDGTDSSNPVTPNWQGTYHAADHGPRTSPIILSTYWMWRFRGTADVYGEWRHVDNTGSIQTGEGYTMKGTSGTAGVTDTQNYVFKGKPHNGSFTRQIDPNMNYLLGNPYPSAMDADSFILDNLAAPTGNNTQNIFNGVLYFWDHFAGQTHYLEEYIGGYAAYSLAGGVPGVALDPRINDNNSSGTKIPSRYIPVAQGFFLLTNGDTNSEVDNYAAQSGPVVFQNSQRIGVREGVSVNGEDPSTFMIADNNFKSATQSTKERTQFTTTDSRAKIRLKFKSPKSIHRQILVTKDDKTTNGYDIGYDAPLADNNIEDMYWIINEREYVIQAVPDFEEDQVLPLGVKIDEEGEFTIQLDSTENWTAGKPIYLKDKKLDTIHDLITSPYISTAEPGKNNDRFEIVFFNEKEEASNPDPITEIPTDLPLVDGLVGVSYSHFSRQIKISNEDLLEVSGVMIFDMNGRLIQEFDGLPTEKEILLGMRPVRSGIYIVKVFCENAYCDKKIIVK